jgi:hypothetical protein
MILRNDDLLLETFFMDTNQKYERYQSLSESGAKKVSRSAVDKMIKSIKKKTLKINYNGIEKTKGDITKFSKYDDFKGCLDTLKKLATGDKNAPNEINLVSRTHDVLIKYKSQFQKAFDEKNDLLIITYTNISATMISLTADLVVSTIEWIKEPQGYYKAIYKETAQKELNGSIYVKSLDKFLALEKKGDLNRLFTNSDKISESFESTFHSTKGNRIFNEEVIAISLAVIGVIVALVFSIRDVVFLYYFLKRRISDELLALAYFTEQNVYRLQSSGNANPDVIAKQTNLVEKLRYHADKLMSDKQSAEKRVQAEVERENKDISDELNDSANTSNDDIILI